MDDYSERIKMARIFLKLDSWLKYNELYPLNWLNIKKVLEL